MTRAEKIKALEAINTGSGSVGLLMGEVWEMWTGTDRDPGNFTNEATGHRLTASQLQARQRARPWLNIFETVKSYQ